MGSRFKDAEKEVEGSLAKIEGYFKAQEGQTLELTRGHIRELTLLEATLRRDKQWDPLHPKLKNRYEKLMGELRRLEREQSGTVIEEVVPTRVKGIKFRPPPPVVQRIVITDTGEEYKEDYTSPPAPPIVRDAIGGEKAQGYCDQIPDMMNNPTQSAEQTDAIMGGKTPQQQRDFLFGPGSGATDEQLNHVIDLMKQGRFRDAVNYAKENQLDRGGLLTMVAKSAEKVTRTIQIPTSVFNVRVNVPLTIYSNPEALARKRGFADLTLTPAFNYSWVTGDKTVTGYQLSPEGNELVETEERSDFTRSSHFYNLGARASFNLFWQTFTPSLSFYLTPDNDLALDHVKLTVGHPRNPIFSNLQSASVRLERPLILGPAGMKPGTYQVTTDATIMVPLGSPTALAFVPALRVSTEGEVGGGGGAYFRYQKGIWRFGVGAQAEKIPGEGRGWSLGPSIDVMDVLTFSPTFYTADGSPVSYNFSVNPVELVKRIKGE